MTPVTCIIIAHPNKIIYCVFLEGTFRLVISPFAQGKLPDKIIPWGIRRYCVFFPWTGGQTSIHSEPGQHIDNSPPSATSSGGFEHQEESAVQPGLRAGHGVHVDILQYDPQFITVILHIKSHVFRRKPTLVRSPPGYRLDKVV